MVNTIHIDDLRGSKIIWATVDENVDVAEFIYNNFKLYAAVLLLNENHNTFYHYRCKQDDNIILIKSDQYARSEEFVFTTLNYVNPTVPPVFKEIDILDELYTFKKLPFEIFRQIVTMHLDVHWSGEYGDVYVEFDESTRKLTIQLFYEYKEWCWVCDAFDMRDNEIDDEASDV